MVVERKSVSYIHTVGSLLVFEVLREKQTLTLSHTNTRAHKLVNRKTAEAQWRKEFYPSLIQMMLYISSTGSGLPPTPHPVPPTLTTHHGRYVCVHYDVASTSFVPR